MSLFNLRPRQRDLWLTRSYYFVALGGTGFIAPYLNLFYIRVGLSGTDIGIVAAVGSTIALMAAPVWTGSSNWRNPRGMLQIALLLVALSYFLLGYQTAFFGIAIVAVMRSVVGAGIAPMSDSLALSVTGATKAGFGSVRVWASMGWIVSVLFSGWLIEQAGFASAFGGVCLVTILGAVFLFPIEAQHFFKERRKSKPNGLRTIISNLVRNRPMLGIGLMLIVIGIANSGVNQFETVYLNTLGAKESLLGIAGMLSAVVEVPCMLWADRLVRKHGAHRLLLIAMLATGLLRAVVLFAPSVATIMIVRAIGGIPFSFYVIALTGFIGEQAQPQETGTVLALYTVTLANLVGIVSAPLAGAAYDAFGARWLYAIAIVGYGLAWICLRLTPPKNQT